jgi:hemoglobin
VEALLRRFYGEVLMDELLAQPFTMIRRKGLESHLPVMCDFWETVLFRAGRYQRSALRAHQDVHDRHTLTARHFLRWLTLWNSTVDQMFDGPVAGHAKIQAARIARAMHRRLTGIDSEELDALIDRRSGVLRSENDVQLTRLPNAFQEPRPFRRPRQPREPVRCDDCTTICPGTSSL